MGSWVHFGAAYFSRTTARLNHFSNFSDKKAGDEDSAGHIFVKKANIPPNLNQTQPTEQWGPEPPIYI